MSLLTGFNRSVYWIYGWAVETIRCSLEAAIQNHLHNTLDTKPSNRHKRPPKTETEPKEVSINC